MCADFYLTGSPGGISKAGKCSHIQLIDTMQKCSCRSTPSLASHVLGASQLRLPWTHVSQRNKQHWTLQAAPMTAQNRQAERRHLWQNTEVCLEWGKEKAEITLHSPFLLIWAHTSLEMWRLSCWDLGAELFCQFIQAGKASASYKPCGRANAVESFIKEADEDSWV